MSIYNSLKYTFFRRSWPVRIIVVSYSMMVFTIVAKYLIGLLGVHVEDKVFTWILIGIGGVMAIMLVFTFMLRYLDNPDASRKKKDFDFEFELNDLRAELKAISKSIKDIGKVEFDIREVHVRELQDTVTRTITEALNKNIFTTVDQAFAERDLKNKEYERLITNFEGIKDGLKLEKEALSRRANLNLTFGTLTTIIAGAGLIFVVFVNPLDLNGVPPADQPWRIVAHYIPRLSLIIFAELFAYFFLKLYKTGLADIKYYQNEISNIEMKLIALKAAISLKDADAIKTVICDLSKTERNFVLKPGETTTELEKFKHDGIDTKGLAESITAALKAR